MERCEQEKDQQGKQYQEKQQQKNKKKKKKKHPVRNGSLLLILLALLFMGGNEFGLGGGMFGLPFGQQKSEKTQDDKGKDSSKKQQYVVELNEQGEILFEDQVMETPEGTIEAIKEKAGEEHLSDIVVVLKDERAIADNLQEFEQMLKDENIAYRFATEE